MKHIFIFLSILFSVSILATNQVCKVSKSENQTNTITDKVIKQPRKRKMLEDTESAVSTNKTKVPLKMEREDEEHDNVKIYIAREGWQTNFGFREMQKYLKTLAEICSDRIPKLVYGIAAGKNGIMMQVSFKAQRKFYGARENTEEFLSAIVGDLEKMPEPIAPEVRMTCNGKEIIKAYRSGDKIKVKFLL